MTNASRAGCCGSTRAKAEEQPGASEQQEKSGCCGDSEAVKAQAQGPQAAQADAGSTAPTAKADRKRGCC